LPLSSECDMVSLNGKKDRLRLECCNNIEGVIYKAWEIIIVKGTINV